MEIKIWKTEFVSNKTNSFIWFFTADCTRIAFIKVSFLGMKLTQYLSISTHTRIKENILPIYKYTCNED